MPNTNYSNGFANGVTIRGMPILNAYPGATYWVDSNAVHSGNKGTFARPFTTIALAVAAAKASAGDLVMVKAGHAETISAAGGIALSKAGVAIIGLGVGRLRPTITLGTLTSATMTVTGANVALKNFRFKSALLNVVAALNVTAVGFSCEDVEFCETSSILTFKSAITCSGAANTADDLYVARCRFRSQAAGTLGFILTTDDINNLEVINNVVISEGTGLATLITNATGKDMTQCLITGNVLSSKATAGNLFISNDTASPNNSGIIADNYCGHADVTAGHILGVVGGCRMFNNLSVSTDALSGFVIPAIDVDS